MSPQFDASNASPSRLAAHELARQAICPNCRREDRSAIWGDPLRCDECHGRELDSHFHAVYRHRRIGEQRILTFDTLEQAKRFANRHTRVGSYRFDVAVSCQCSAFMECDDAMLTVIRRHDAGTEAAAS